MWQGCLICFETEQKNSTDTPVTQKITFFIGTLKNFLSESLKDT